MAVGTRTISDDDLPRQARELTERHAVELPAPWFSSTVRDPGATCETSVDLTGTVEPPRLSDPLEPVFAGGSEVGGRYRVGPLLGHGGGGMVFALSDHHTRREVALKVLHPHHAGDARRQQRLIEEACVTASLEHPNILPVYDLDRAADGRCYFTMRLARGRSLQELIAAAAEGCEPPAAIRGWNDRVDVLLKVCDALAYAHHRGVIHQDIKPANILVGDYGEVLLVDWGTAQRLDAIAAAPRRLMGTPVYMAPEQARREASDERSDVYGLGATLWHLLTLRHPLSGDQEPALFWARKQRGEVDALPAELRARIPASLLAIAERALAPDPAARQQRIVDLRAELLAWQRHRDSEAVCERAERVLAGLESGGDHLGFVRVAEDFRHALELWPDNARARAGMRAAAAAHARHALAHGDLDLAAEVLDPAEPAHAALAAEVSAARVARREHRARGRRLRLTLAGALLLLLMAGGWLALDAFRYHGAWRPVFERAFDSSSSLAGFELTESDVHHPLALPSPSLDGLELPPAHMLWLTAAHETGDVRISVDLSWPGPVDGFEVLVRSERANPPTQWMVPRGYSCQFASESGSRDYVAVNPMGQMPQVEAARPAAYQSGRRYHLEFTCQGDRLAVAVDGRETVAYRNLLPLGGRLGWIALRGWSAVRIHRVAVERLGLPEKASPLVAGDALFAAGHLGDAIASWRGVASDFPRSALADDALAKAMVAAASAPSLSALRHELLAEFIERHPRSPHRVACLSAEATAAWRDGDHAGALATLAVVQAEDPAARLPFNLLARTERRLAPSIARALLAALVRVPGTNRLQIGAIGLDDLGPLRGSGVRRLYLSQNPITDLEPLRGLALESLDLAGCRVGDLSPLAGMPLRDLNVAQNRIRDLSPLAGMPLVELDARENPLADLAPLAGLPLRGLIVHGTGIRDLGPLAGMPLRSLSIGATAVRRLDALAGSPLEALRAGGCRLESLAPLRGLPLTLLEVPDCGLERLDELVGCPLEHLNVAGNPVTDLAPLAATPLRELFLDRSGVRDLMPLAGSGLRALSAADTAVADLDPLRGLKLEQLDIDRTRVADLAPIAHLPLRRLTCRDCPVRDLTPLHARAPLDGVQLDNALLGPADYAALAKAWRERGANQRAAQIETGAALRAGDVAAMHRLAQRQGGRGYLALPGRVPLAEAEALAARFGARLLCLHGEEEADLLRTLAPGLTGVWLGLRRVGDGWRWHDGRDLDAGMRGTFSSVDDPSPLGWYRLSSANYLIPAVPGIEALAVLEWDLPGAER